MKYKKIFLSPPDMGGDELKYIKKAFDENYITSAGSNIIEFENRVKQYTNAKNILATINATSAIHLALRIIGVKSGDEVFASSFTFIGSIAPILYQNAKPVFIDSDKKSWNLSPKLLLKAIKEYKKNSKKLPKALILTHLYGQLADIKKIAKICKDNKIILIEDAAESLGASFKKKQSGVFGDFGVYSFNGNKILTTSGGGILVAKNSKNLEYAKFLSTQAKENMPHYEHITYGYNYRMSNILAGVGIAQMDLLKKRVKQKRVIFKKYKKAFPDLKFMPEIKNSYGNRWLTTLLFKNYAQREAVRKMLEINNIESRPLWKPMHLQPLFKNSKAFVNKVSEKLFKRGLCLPSGSSLKNSEQNRIIELIKKEIYA